MGSLRVLIIRKFTYKSALILEGTTENTIEETRRVIKFYFYHLAVTRKFHLVTRTLKNRWMLIKIFLKTVSIMSKAFWRFIGNATKSTTIGYKMYDNEINDIHVENMQQSLLCHGLILIKWHPINTFSTWMQNIVP